MKKTCVELFAGVGGFRCGLNKVSFDNDKVIEMVIGNFYGQINGNHLLKLKMHIIVMGLDLVLMM